MSYDPTEHSITEVHDYLDENPDEAAAVLAAEQARGEDARKTLVADLERRVKPDEETVDTPAQTEGEEYVKPEDANISPPGEYPTEGTPGIWGYHTDEPGVQAGRQS